MREVYIGWVVHITRLDTGEQWYSGQRSMPEGTPPYVYKNKGTAEAYAAGFNRHDLFLANVEEHEYTEEEDT